MDNKKRVPISSRMRQVIIAIALFSMLAIGIVSITMMYRIRNRSEEYIISNMEESVMGSLRDVAIFTEKELSEYLNQVKESASYAERLYLEPQKYLPRVVSNHMHVTNKNYCFRRYLASEKYDENTLRDEINLLTNMESFWVPLLQNNSDNITSIYIGTESGFFVGFDKIHIDDETNEEGENYFDYFTRPWYLEAKYEGKPIFTDMGEDYFGRGQMVTCATPFFNNGKIAGVVAIDILVKDIQNNIIAIDVGEGGYTFAVDKHGNVVVPSGDGALNVSDSIKDEKKEINVIAKNILSGMSGIDMLNDSYYAYSPINNIGWVLCAKIPKVLISHAISGFDKSIKSMMTNFIVMALMILVFIIIISNAFSKRITGPINMLTDDVKIISGGNLDYKAKVIGNNEISDLANSFNTMTSSLKKYVTDLTDLAAERERAGAELSIATNIQSAMLPSVFPAFPEDDRFDIFATMHPAKEVGGDFYDFFKVDDRHIAIVIADVSGKGVPASLFMAIGKTLIKDHTFFQDNLAAVFYTVNNFLCESNKENLFITAFEGLIDLETGLMSYVNAGHELPFIYRKGKDWTAHDMKAGFVLAGMEYIQYSIGTIQLEHGDKLFEYTDGVTEATSSNNELYGMDRLKAALDKNADKPVMDLLPAIKEDIDRFVGEAPQFDDITMLAFEYK